MQHKLRALYVHQEEDGTVTVRGRLAPEVGALFINALDAAREALYQRARLRATETADVVTEASTAMKSPSMAQQQADALALVAESALRHDLDPGTPGERYHVVVHVDAPVLTDPDQRGQTALEGGIRVSAETSRRLACDASRVVMRHHAAGTCWRSAPARARSRRRYEGRSSTETRAAASPVAECASDRAITSATGPRAAPRRSRTWPSCVVAITERYTRRASRSSAGRMASSRSGILTVGKSRVWRRPPRFPTIPWGRSGPETRPRGSRSVPTLPRRNGSESAWTWATRSTSSTRGRGETDREEEQAAGRQARRKTWAREVSGSGGGAGGGDDAARGLER